MDIFEVYEKFKELPEAEQIKLRDKILEIHPTEKSVEKELPKKEKGDLKIKDVKVGQKKIELVAKIKQIKDQFKNKNTGDPVAIVRLEDQSGECNLFVYGQESISKLKEGETIRLIDCFCSGEFQGDIDITTGKYGGFALK